jgi:hypothetical protein
VDSKTLKAIQILAINAIENPSYEDQFRFICRWFSKTFSIPLNKVDEFLEEEILQAWFEERFKEMLDSGDDEQRKAYEEIRQNILYEEELKTAEDEDEEWVKEMQRQVEEDQKKQQSQSLPEELNLLDIPEQGDLSDLSFIDDIES